MACLNFSMILCASFAYNSVKVIKNLNTRSEKKKIPVIPILIIGSLIHLYIIIKLYKFGAISPVKCRLIGGIGSYEYVFPVIQTLIMVIIFYAIYELH